MTDASDAPRDSIRPNSSEPGPAMASCDRAREAAREGAEVLAGFALLGFQRLQVHRRDLERSMGIPAGTPLLESIRRVASSMTGR